MVERAIAVDQGGRYPIDLGFDGDGDAPGPEVLLESPVEVGHFLLGEDVIDGEHGHGVPDLLETLEGCSTYPAGRRVGIVQFRVLAFQVLQFAEKLVIIRIGDLRLGLDIVEPVVVLKKGAKLVDPFSGRH